jgi:hypothetical protein
MRWVQQGYHGQVVNFFYQVKEQRGTVVAIAVTGKKSFLGREAFLAAIILSSSSYKKA